MFVAVYRWCLKPGYEEQLRRGWRQITEDDHFAELFSNRGQPALSPWRLALVTLMQFAEGLTDRQAADAVRARLDWKYVLSLELDHPGFHYSVLSEFRDRLLRGSPETLLLDRLLELCRLQGWLRTRSRQRTDSTHIQSAVRTLAVDDGCLSDLLPAQIEIDIERTRLWAAGGRAQDAGRDTGAGVLDLGDLAAQVLLNEVAQALLVGDAQGGER